MFSAARIAAPCLLIASLAGAGCDRTGFDESASQSDDGDATDQDLGGDSSAELYPGYTDVPFYGTCDQITSLGLCRQWVGATFASINLLFSCATLGGLPGTGACVDANALGVCVTLTSVDDRVDFFYYGNTWSTATAAADCAGRAVGATTAEWYPRQ